MFLSPRSTVRILTVTEMSWGKTSHPVKGRPFAALSLRLVGDSHIEEGEKTERLTAGDVFYMPKGADYRIDCAEERVIVVHFDTDETASPHMERIRPENTAHVTRLFRSLLDAWERNRGRTDTSFEPLAAFYRILAELSRTEARGSAEAAPDTRAAYEKLRPAAEYLHAHFTDPDLDVETLCKKAFMSDTYLRRLFRLHYGTTPLRYLNTLRLEHAHVLLSEGTCSVSEAAQNSGFSDPKYFSTLFRKHYGISPSALRDLPSDTEKHGRP